MRIPPAHSTNSLLSRLNTMKVVKYSSRRETKYETSCTLDKTSLRNHQLKVTLTVTTITRNQSSKHYLRLISKRLTIQHRNHSI